MDLHKLKQLGYSSYSAYLRSQHWLRKREDYFIKYGRHCVICYSTEKVHVHHKTYDRLGEERLTDLASLCDEHHEKLHEYIKLRGVRLSRGLDSFKRWLDQPEYLQKKRKRHKRTSLGPKKALRTGRKSHPVYPIKVSYDPSIIVSK